MLEGVYDLYRRWSIIALIHHTWFKYLFTPPLLFWKGWPFGDPHKDSALLVVADDLGSQELTFIEFFAGTGNCWRAIRASSEWACGVDINYMEKVDGKQNPFDILSNAGMMFTPYFVYRPIYACMCLCDWLFKEKRFGIQLQFRFEIRLAIHLILSAKEGCFATLWGTVCSSWVHINSFTSKRTLLNPEGDTSRRYIEQANTMVSRCLCLYIYFIYHVTMMPCFHGVFSPCDVYMNWSWLT